MRFDSAKAIDHVCHVVKTAATLDAGVDELFEYCRALQPRSKLWKKLRPINFVGDAEFVKKSLNRELRTPKLTRRYTGFYFGLDGLNMPDGKGIEFGCSRHYDPAVPGIRWVYRCDLYPGEVLSAALSELYSSGLEQGGLADYVICLGYTGLALRHAFETTSPEKLLGGAPHRAVIWGFHDGDLLVLGVIRPGGFERLASRDPDPDATEQRKPELLPGTSLGKFFHMRRSLNRKQWQLDADEEAGIDFTDLFPGSISRKCKELARPLPLRIRVDGPRVGLADLFHGGLVADARSAQLLKRVAPGDLEFIPAQIKGVRDTYFVADPVLVPIEREATNYTVVVPAKAAGRRQIFRASESSHLIVTARAKQTIEEAGITSRRFDPVLARG